jgi:hypothetical protein
VPVAFTTAVLMDSGENAAGQQQERRGETNRQIRQAARASAHSDLRFHGKGRYRPTSRGVKPGPTGVPESQLDEGVVRQLCSFCARTIEHH